MTGPVVLGVDVGTSSSKGVLVDGQGRVLASTVRSHEVDRPRPGHVEMDPDVWWEEFTSIADELTAGSEYAVAAVGVSGMGPCVALCDEDGRSIRPAILYGVDTRAGRQIEELERELGADAILAVGGTALSSQAAGPKIAWVAQEEPGTYGRARMFLMPASLLVHRLTGRYVLDHHSASQCTPMYDARRRTWHRDWCRRVAPGLELPELAWAGEVAGRTTTAIAGIPAGTPVITGTIDAWAEAVSVGATEVGDLMLMYGTTMFLVATVAQPVRSGQLWGTLGVTPGTTCLAGGMSTGGAVTTWLRDLTGSTYDELTRAARDSGPGARGLVMLPYFAGERTPVQDPRARGVVAGLTLTHDRGDLYRAALEAVGFGVRHHLDVLRAAGVPLRRAVAVGGGTQGDLWTQIVSDITGQEQLIPAITVGASYGAARLAAAALGSDVRSWNPPARTILPDPGPKPGYDAGYADYRELYRATTDTIHRLADRQTAASL